ncbi:MAG: GIY-YIG nuclease family protein [Rhodothalassiaceae bacterium]
MFYVYIMTNRRRGVLYTGMTDDLVRRVYEHRAHLRPGFTDRYNCTHLAWYEPHSSRETAFVRERRLKTWRRAWKITLIETANPHWRDLWTDIAPP